MNFEKKASFLIIEIKKKKEKKFRQKKKKKSNCLTYLIYPVKKKIMEDITNIIHNIEYRVKEQELQKAIKTVEKNISGVENLTKRQIALAKRYNETAVQDEKTRTRITSLINRNSTALNNHKKSLEDNLINNKSLNKAMQQELGLIGAVEKKLSILKRARQTATSPQEIARYNNLIAQQQAKINKPQAQNIPTQNIPKGVGGLPNALVGQVGRLIPAIGGALALGGVALQIKEVTQQFEKYRTVLRNTFQSSTKANQEFEKIKDFAKDTPYSVDELTGSFVKLVNRGFNPTKEELTNMGDIAASQGKSFDQLTEAVLDAQTGEFERLKEFGIKAKTTGDIVTLSFKGVEKQVKKTDEVALRNAIISFGQLQGVAGGMEAQSQTLEGKLSNLGDSFDSLFSNIGGKGIGAFGALIDVVKEAVDWLNEFVEVSPVDALREQQGELNNLVSQLILVNNEEELRSEVMAEISAKYPEFLSFINSEKTSVESLSEALGILNQQYEHKIRLASIDDGLAEKSEKQKKLFTEQREALNKLIPALKEYGYTEVEFSKLSRKEQQRVGTEALSQLAEKKAKQANERIRTSTRESAGMYEVSQVESIVDAREDFNNYFKLSDQLTSERNKLLELRNAKEESYRNGLKETLKIEEEQLQLLIKQGASKQKIAEQQGIINGINLLLNPVTTKPQSTTPDTGKSKKKQKTAQELALEDIDKRQKIEEEKQKQAYERQMSQLKKALEEKLIDQNYYNHVEQEYTETNKIELLKIEKKYDSERLKYLKEAEKEATKTKIANIDNSVKDIQLALRSRSEQLLKEAIDNAKKLDEELSNLLASEEQREIDAVNKKFADSKSQLSGTKTFDELLIADADLIGAEKDGDSERIETAKKRIDQLKQILKKETQLTEQEEIERQTAILEIQDKYFEKRELEATKRAISALNEYNYYEQQKFDTKFNQTDDEGVNVVQAENDIKLEQLKNANAEIIDEETLSNRKRLKLEEERAKNSEEIARRTQLAIQFIEKDGIEKSIANKQEELKKIQSGELQVTEAYKDKIEKELSDLLANLGLTQKQIEELFAQLGKSSEKGLSDATSAIFSLTDAMLSASSSIVSALESIADKEIEVRERRVEKANEIADRGNAEALQIEEEKLQKAQAQKEKYARIQMAINLAQQASALALAIAQAAAAGGGWASAAAIASVITAVGSGIATVMQMTADQPQGFKEGVIALNGKGSETSDSIPAMLSRGESVITAKGTKIGDNSKILEAMNNGVAFSTTAMSLKSPQIPSIVNNSNIKTEMSGIRKGLENVVQAVENIKGSSIVIDEDGFIAMSRAIEMRTKKRNKL